MAWPVFAIAGGVLLMALFAFSLAAASNTSGGSDAEMEALGELNRLKGPGGKPFFADDEAMWNLAEQLEDPELAERHEPRPPGRQTPDAAPPPK